MSMLRVSDFSLQSLGMGLLVAFVGFTSSFAIILQGLRAAGASDAQAASGLMALSIAMGISGIWLSAVRRLPISVAWSTPGAALLISSGHTLPDFATAVGAFVTCAVLLFIAGLYKPLARAIEMIPASLANAMLAGILLLLCLAPMRAIAFDPLLALPVILSWWLVGQYRRHFAIPAALLVLVVVVAWRLGVPPNLGDQLVSALRPQPVFVAPVFDLRAIISIAIPLFVVTMASQNVPGIAVLRANGYTPSVSPLITNTAGFSLLAAVFGGHAVNLAAITAALCAGPDAHADPGRRYWSAIVAGMTYVIFGLLAGVVGLLLTLIPSILVEAIAGLALIGAFTGALVAAFASAAEREAAAITFLFAGSGLAFLGVGGAFWGLLAGGAMVLVKRWRSTTQANTL